MNRLETLIDEYDGSIEFGECDLPVDGLYFDGTCLVKKENRYFKKLCVACEEVGHHVYTVGNILDQRKVSNVKQERVARAFAYNRLAPIERIKEAIAAGCIENWQITEYLELDDDFVADAIEYYRSKELL